MTVNTNDSNQMNCKVTRKTDSEFKKGLRDFFGFRDLEISEATSSQVIVHVIRALPGHEMDGSGTHYHDLEFEMV